MKISTKLTYSFLVITFATMLAIIGTVYFTVLSNFERIQGEHLKDNVSKAAIAIDEFMLTRVKDLNAFSNSPIFSIGTIEEIENHLSEIVKGYPFYDVISYTDLEGVILASSSENLAGKNILIEEPDIKEEFIKTISGGAQDVYISDIAEVSQMELEAHSPLDIELLSDIVDKSGTKIGVLVGFVNTVFIENYVFDIDERTIGNEYAYLVNDPGDIVITADSNVEILKPHPDLEIGNLRQKLEGDEHGYMVYVNSKGRKVVSAYADLSEYGTEGVGDWSLLSTAPYNDIMAPVYSLLYKIIFIFVLVFFVIVFSAVVLSRTLTKPILKLRDATLGIGKGNLDFKVEVESKDEIGQLAVSLNQMVENLKKSNIFLQESEENYRILVSSVKDYAIFMITPSGIVTSWNEGVKAIKGYEADEVIGKHISIFYPEEDIKAGKIEHELQRAKEDGEYEDEGWRVRKDGSRFWANVVITAIHDESGKLAGYTKVTRDFTERKKTEDQLRKYRDHLETLVEERTQELEKVHVELVSKERLATLGELIATVSHEVRNPLGTIRNAVYSIGASIEENKMDSVNRALKLAERGITRCNRIINELLDYSRKRELKLEQTEIDSWLKGVLDEQEFPKNIKCVRELHSGIVLLIDREYMWRVVSNVITNAIQALQEDGPRGNQITVESVKTGDCLELRFTDTGPGIPDEIREKIFEPLFSTKSFGVGLGVPIIKNIMEELQGEVKFQSEVDKGTIVTLTIPIHKLEKKR